MKAMRLGGRLANAVMASTHRKSSSYFSTAAAVPNKKEARKEAREKERVKIMEDINRGYFQDIKEMKEHGGKVFATSTELEDAQKAVIFPKSIVYKASRESFIFPLKDNARANLVCLSFRASAEQMVDSWISPLRNTLPSKADLQINELSWVESGILSFYPVRKLFLMCISASKECKKADRNVLYAFGDSYDIRKALHVTNRLTGYIYLVDQSGRIRWSASGKATSEEASHLVSCTLRLLEGYEGKQ